MAQLIKIISTGYLGIYEGVLKLVEVNVGNETSKHIADSIMSTYKKNINK